ncbi:MAG TPA: hypothetical protein VF483_04845 [Gemmatimonadaceae bacterium]
MTMQSAASAQGKVATTQAATSVQDALAAYKSRRSELNNQLVELTVRRDLLTQQLRNASGPQVQELNAQLTEVGHRNSAVIKSLGEIDDAINKLLTNSPVVVSGAPTEGVTVPGIAIVPPPVTGVQLPPDAWLGVAGVAVVAMVVTLWRTMRRPVFSLSSTDVGRLEKLQQSVDAIALEVERLGESQRYVSRVLSENRIIGAGAAESVGALKREDAPANRRS